MVLHLNHVHNLIIIIREQVGHWVLAFWLSIHLAGVLGSLLLPLVVRPLQLSLAMSAVLEKVPRPPVLLTKSFVFSPLRLFWLFR